MSEFIKNNKGTLHIVAEVSCLCLVSVYVMRSKNELDLKIQRLEARLSAYEEVLDEHQRLLIQLNTLVNAGASGPPRMPQKRSARPPLQQPVTQEEEEEEEVAEELVRGVQQHSMRSELLRRGGMPIVIATASFGRSDNSGGGATIEEDIEEEILPLLPSKRVTLLVDDEDEDAIINAELDKLKEH